MQLTSHHVLIEFERNREQIEGDCGGGVLQNGKTFIIFHYCQKEECTSEIGCLISFWPAMLLQAQSPKQAPFLMHYH